MRYGESKRKSHRHRRLRVTQKERRSGQRFYGVSLELERNEAKTRTSERVDGGAYGVEGEVRKTKHEHGSTKNSKGGTHTVIQCDAFFDGPEDSDLRYILRYPEL
jgi:hypothetical protein